MLQGSRKHHLLLKLYNREVWSSFFPHRISSFNRARQLFQTIPDRLMFYLKDILQKIGNHVFIGTTQCGQFLITYSYGIDQTANFKYRLHWWAFRPGAPAHKVAEVQLFDNPDISSALTIGIAQWPKVNDRLVAYGYCYNHDNEEEQESECRRYYMTITTLPSLHNCRDCRMVAASFDEEDMAANWDSCVGLSCLKHGLTVHTLFEVAPPYPLFDIQIAMKSTNCIIVNTGNFLHVLIVDLEYPNSKIKSHCDNIVPGDIKHRLEESLASLYYISPWAVDVSYKMERHKSYSDTASESGSDIIESSPHAKMLSEAASLCLEPAFTKHIQKFDVKPLTMDWLTKITDLAEKVYAFKDSDDGCEPKFKWYCRRRLADKMYEFCSDDEDMENIQPSAQSPRCHFTPSLLQIRETFCERITKSQESEKVSENSILEKHGIQNRDYVKISSSEYEFVNIKPSISKQDCEINIMNRNVLDYREKEKEINLVNKQKLNQIVINPIGKGVKNCDHQYKRVTLGDKYNDTSLASIKLESNDMPECVTSKKMCNPHKSENIAISVTENLSPKLLTELTLKTDDVTTKHVNPDLNAIIADWEVDSLSPKSDYVTRSKENKNEVIQRFLELIPGMSSKYIRPFNKTSLTINSSQSYFCGHDIEGYSHSIITSEDSKQRTLLRVALKPCNRIKRKKKENSYFKTTSKEKKVKVQKEMVFGRQEIPGCSVQFDRRYIEQDGEIISTTTEIEDDDTGTGYHCALPLSVHGSAYSQLQMITNHKIGKLSTSCGLVRQTTLDIEQVCFKAADIICNCEGYKFWFCSDYDVEIIDVCPLNGDILALVCMRVNAENKWSRPGKRDNMIGWVDPRAFYICQCVVIWNPEQDKCWLEVYSPPTEGPLPSARYEATIIKSKLPPGSMFTLPMDPPMRSFIHNMWAGDRMLVASLEVIRDHMNLIGFRLLRNEGMMQVIRDQ
uniref:DDB1- and CUL4-associated factor 15 WD40 repeat-containing domain-containing protein n=2 Tax=Clastoptera arizonana TaxID=38151 RepID=A0A1B6E7W5_9HEMI